MSHWLGSHLTYASAGRRLKMRDEGRHNSPLDISLVGAVGPRPVVCNVYKNPGVNFSLRRLVEPPPHTAGDSFSQLHLAFPARMSMALYLQKSLLGILATPHMGGDDANSDLEGEDPTHPEGVLPVGNQISHVQSELPIASSLPRTTEHGANSASAGGVDADTFVATSTLVDLPSTEDGRSQRPSSSGNTIAPYRPESNLGMRSTLLNTTISSQVSRVILLQDHVESTPEHDSATNVQGPNNTDRNSAQ
ncbi:unnamed protein product [Rhizoctonia solani]|uniref:Uncharacterized protein n=1 Tax=Rhizoctonia solani TaxID=456999 RepID=A0A8H3DT08_9AGAM|nr:unnamed protein product [Rhizoctonia solani]